MAIDYLCLGTKIIRILCLKCTQEDEQDREVYISGYLAFNQKLRFPIPERLYRLLPNQRVFH